MGQSRSACFPAVVRPASYIRKSVGKPTEIHWMLFADCHNNPRRLYRVTITPRTNTNNTQIPSSFPQNAWVQFQSGYHICSGHPVLKSAEYKGIWDSGSVKSAYSAIQKSILPCIPTATDKSNEYFRGPASAGHWLPLNPGNPLQLFRYSISFGHRNPSSASPKM